MRREIQRRLARTIAAVIVAVISALIGHKQLSGKKETGPTPGGLEGRGRPIDGDSLYVAASEVRLKGIDAPEGRQSCTRNGVAWDCGNAAREELRRLIGGDAVTCEVSERDRHSRLLAYCSAGGRDLNAGMVAAGLALAYGDYTSEEARARAQKRGLWSGEFTRPRDWREEHNIGR